MNDYGTQRVINAAAWRRHCRALLRFHDVPCDAGDCHTASAALCALLRNEGLPARTVTGSVQVSVQQKSISIQHSWVEIYDVLVDPTAGQTVGEIACEIAGAAAPALGVSVPQSPEEPQSPGEPQEPQEPDATKGSRVVTYGSTRCVYYRFAT